MKKPEFTNGPWRTRSAGGATHIEADTQVICLVGHRNERANAALIAAAPSLYAACVALLEILEPSGIEKLERDLHLELAKRAILDAIALE